MKKLGALVIIFIGCLSYSSCWIEDYGYKPDKSLTGSISYSYLAEIYGTFDGDTLIDDSNSNKIRGLIDIDKLSDAKVSFICNAIWENEKAKITIPNLLVLGKPYDVTFDYLSDDASANYESSDHEYTEYENVSVSIKGWMKEETGNWAMTRKIAYPNYDCDIEIKCTIDGKELVLNITKMEGM